MFAAGWGVGGEAWKWRRRLFAWEEELVAGYIARLSNVSLQTGVPDSWVWQLHNSGCYSVKSAYSYLTASEVRLNENFDKFLWLRSVPLKVNIFVWRLFLDRLPTKSNLLRRGSLGAENVYCSTMCGTTEDLNHLFFQCDVYSRLWLMILQWLGVFTALQGELNAHSIQFSGLGSNQKTSFIGLTVIWVATLYVIWRDRNNRLFKSVLEPIEKLAEKVKLQTFWWLKSRYISFDFDYSVWRQQPWLGFQAIL
ncbi:hypothetical protein TSUD_383110 [Trifolium subterraneum]|uniref:Reverse transcriptase zinc-binding domain-containing protein n=1 Tax=Trifolium subterraneum TaxID=3900 RepID=A0A2Z6LS15_TRISU|nr:hypothetical protein TSUD_383110 [Trifolium subterraneum]